MASVIEKARIITQATIENVFDLFEVRDGIREINEVRRISEIDLEVDVNTLTVSLSRDMISSLDLPQSCRNGSVQCFGPVRLTIQGRSCHVDVFEQAQKEMAVIGHVPLTFLDLVVDPRSQKLIGNPEHGVEQMLECY